MLRWNGASAVAFVDMVAFGAYLPVFSENSAVMIFTDHAPAVFADIRAQCGISPEQYVVCSRRFFHLLCAFITVMCEW